MSKNFTQTASAINLQLGNAQGTVSYPGGVSAGFRGVDNSGDPYVRCEDSAAALIPVEAEGANTTAQLITASQLNALAIGNATLGFTTGDPGSFAITGNVVETPIPSTAVTAPAVGPGNASLSLVGFDATPTDPTFANIYSSDGSVSITWVAGTPTTVAGYYDFSVAGTDSVLVSSVSLSETVSNATALFGPSIPANAVILNVDLMVTVAWGDSAATLEVEDSATTTVSPTSAFDLSTIGTYNVTDLVEPAAGQLQAVLTQTGFTVGRAKLIVRYVVVP